MRVAIGISASILLAAAVFFAAQSMFANAEQQPASAPTPGERAWPGGKFVVHEWGTFTSFSGSDSVKLEFRPLVDQDLPEFVLDRGRQAGVLNPFLKFDLRVLQRMETPVTYFYTDAPRQPSVKVGFPQGLLTEFYPPVETMLPEHQWLKETPLTNSSLDWGKVWIVPEDRLQVKIEDPALASKLRERMLQKVLPRTYGQDHYAFARETDSALVYVERARDKKRPALPSGAFFEKFLFYRGVGNFELPLKLSAFAGERFALTNLGREPIRSLFLVTVEEGQIRFATYDQIAAGQTLSMSQSASPATIDELSEAVVQKLVAARLYEKEARAMVKTWRASWFGEDGTRLFYLLPEANTEALLPLSLDPKPDEVVRVMVGRMEIMRPEDEERITAIVKQSQADRAAAWEERQNNLEAPVYTLPKAILDLGRLAEPALIRVKHLATDGQIRGEAMQLLGELQQHRSAAALQTTAR